jgi:hypothetical protein
LTRANDGHTYKVRNSRWWVILAAAAVVIAVALLIAPTGISETCTAASGGPEVCTQVTTSMLSGEGLWVLAPLSVPALTCLLPAILPARWIGNLVAAALLVFCFLTGFSIGLFFLPVAVAALVLALSAHRSQQRHSATP